MSNSDIFILDEKVQRQEVLAPYLKTLLNINLISNPDDLSFNNIEDLFKNTSIVCMHNSFFDSQKSVMSQTRVTLEKFIKDKQLSFVLFGGGIASISKVGDSLLFLPVSIFYRNLEYYYNNHFTKSEIDLNILAFGKNMKNEQILSVRSRLSYIINGLNEDDLVTITDSRTLNDLRKFCDIAGDLSLYYSVTKGEKISRDNYLFKLEQLVQKNINE